MFRRLAVFQQQLIVKRFAGHSKWANIKHIKAIKDQQKATSFLKYARMIRVAIQDGGSTNPQNNLYLRTVIEQATRANMPLATIKNNIKKFNDNDAKLTKYYFEMRALNKICLICELYTDNLTIARNNLNIIIRKFKHVALADIKFIFDEVAYVQAAKIEGKFANAEEFEEKVMEEAIEIDCSEVEDINFDAKSATFLCKPIEIERVKQALMKHGYGIDAAEHIFAPQQTVELSGKWSFLNDFYKYIKTFKFLFRCR